MPFAACAPRATTQGTTGCWTMRNRAGFVFLTMVFYSFYKLTRNKRKLLFLLFLILFVSLFDNHIAIMESMQTIIFLGIVLISDIKKKEWNTYI